MPLDALGLASDNLLPPVRTCGKKAEGNVRPMSANTSNDSVQISIPPVMRNFSHSIHCISSMDFTSESIIFLICAFKSKPEFVPVSSGFQYIYI